MLTTLVLAVTGEPRHELLAFLRAVPDLELLDAPAGESAPDLIIVDACAPGSGSATLLQALRTRLPAARCIALVRSPRQIPKAMAAGADRVLLTGFSTTEFFQILDDLFPPET